VGGVELRVHLAGRNAYNGMNMPLSIAKNAQTSPGHSNALNANG